MDQWLLSDMFKEINDNTSVGNANSLYTALGHAEIVTYQLKTLFFFKPFFFPNNCQNLCTLFHNVITTFSCVINTNRLSSLK